MLDNNMLAVLAKAFATITVGAIIFGINYPGGHLSRVQMSGGQYPSGAIVRGEIIRGAIFLEGKCPGGNYPGYNFPRGQLSSGAIVRGAVIRGTIFLVGNCPDTTIPMSDMSIMFEKITLDSG